MNNLELQAARKLLMLEVSEAAKHIGRVTSRAWQHWEIGRNAVPEYVAIEISDLLEMRSQAIEGRLEQIENAEGAPSLLAFYPRLEDYEAAANAKRSVIYWRLSQSVGAALYAEGFANLIFPSDTEKK